jgi:hypothetical protein
MRDINYMNIIAIEKIVGHFNMKTFNKSTFDRSILMFILDKYFVEIGLYEQTYAKYSGDTFAIFDFKGDLYQYLGMVDILIDDRIDCVVSSILEKIDSVNIDQIKADIVSILT